MAVDKSNQRVRKMFGDIAPNYDRMNHLLSMNVDKYWRWLTVRKTAPNQTDPILDVCSGTGDLAFAYEKSTDSKVPVMASDFCFEMLDVGEKKKKDRSSRIKFIEADAQNLPFESDLFQIVSVAFGLRNVADTDQGAARDDARLQTGRQGGRIGIFGSSAATHQRPVRLVLQKHITQDRTRSSAQRFQRLRLLARQRW